MLRIGRGLGLVTLANVDRMRPDHSQLRIGRGLGLVTL